MLQMSKVCIVAAQKIKIDTSFEETVSLHWQKGEISDSSWKRARVK